jgi:hypothetical protein
MRRFLPALFLPLFLIDGQALASAPAGTEAPVTTAEGPQAAVQILPDGTGGYYVLWEDVVSPQQREPVVQRVGGSAPWAAPIRVGDPGSPSRGGSAMARASSGGVVVTWTGSGAVDKLRMQRLSASGARAFPTPATGPQMNGFFDMAGSGDGAYVLLGAATGTIALLRMDERGNVAWTSPSLGASFPAEVSGRPALCQTPSGEAIATIPRAQITAHKFSPAGAPQWGASGVALTSVYGVKWAASAACDEKGGLAVAWVDARRGAEIRDTFAQTLDPTGRPGWAMNGVEIARDATDVGVTTDGNGGLYVAFTKTLMLASRTLFAAHLKRDGSYAFGAGGGVRQDPGAFNTRLPTWARDGSGGAFLAWKTEPTSTPPGAAPAPGLAIRWLDADGHDKWTTDPVRMGRANAYPIGQTWAVGEGTVGIAWTDARASYPDVYRWSAAATGAKLAPLPAGPPPPAPAPVASSSAGPAKVILPTGIKPTLPALPAGATLRKP